MHVEMRPIDTIRPYANNPRQNDAGVDAVAASIQTVGFRQPIVVDEEGIIIVGHTRYKAARKLGLGSMEKAEINCTASHGRLAAQKDMNLIGGLFPRPLFRTQPHRARAR
jgi:hypothetical protein